jgi:hypothetical protein
MTFISRQAEFFEEKTTFAFKSQENKNHADKNYYQINK